MILKKFFNFLVLILFLDFENVVSFGVQNDNKIEKQLQVEDLPMDGRSVNFRINLINSFNQELKPEVDDLKKAQDKLTLSMAALTEKISKDHKSELSVFREEIKNSLNAQNRNQAAFDERLKRIETAIKSMTTATPAPVPIPIKSAKLDKSFNCVQNCGNAKNLPNDCSEVKNENENKNGTRIFLLKPPQGSELKPFGAVCLKKIKNWTIIQRRLPYKSVSFNRTWEEYKNGFGDLNGEYWLGLERLHQLTANKKYELWMEWRYVNSTSQGDAHYSKFSVADEDNGYRLKVDGFTSRNYILFKLFSGSKFSTYDEDNDGSQSWNCARVSGGGWWYPDECFYSGCLNLSHNGAYIHMAIHPV